MQRVVGGYGIRIGDRRAPEWLEGGAGVLSGRLAFANGRARLDLLAVGASGGNRMAQAAKPISHATVNPVLLACRISASAGARSGSGRSSGAR